jgi:hypothetical protein
MQSARAIIEQHGNRVCGELQNEHIGETIVVHVGQHESVRAFMDVVVVWSRERLRGAEPAE